MKVSSRLKTTVGLKKTEAVDSPYDHRREPLPGAPAVGVLDRQPTKGSTRGR
jgi:hypothetical protein